MESKVLRLRSYQTAALLSYVKPQGETLFAPQGTLSRLPFCLSYLSKGGYFMAGRHVGCIPSPIDSFLLLQGILSRDWLLTVKSHFRD